MSIPTIPIEVDFTVAEDVQRFDMTVAEQNVSFDMSVATPIVTSTNEEYEGPYSVTPSETEQTLSTTDMLMTDDVSIDAIPSDYVGSSIDRNDSSDLSVSGATVTAPSGYYENDASKTIQNATISSSSSVTVNPTLSVNYETGEITASVSKTQSVPVVTSAGYASVTSHDVVMSGNSSTQLITRDSTDMTVMGSTVTAIDGYYPSSASKTIPDAVSSQVTLSVSPQTPTVDANGLVTASVGTTQGEIAPFTSAGYVSTTSKIAYKRNGGSKTLQLDTQSGTTVTPTESEQTAVASGKYTTGAVKVGAISSNYVGSGVTQRTSSDLTVVDDTVTAPSGYYASSASASVPSATWKSASTIGVVPSISVNSSGLITATASGWTSCHPLSASGYADSDTAANLQLTGSKTSQLDTIAATTYTPNKVSTQEIPAGKYTTGVQTIGKIPDEYIIPSGTKNITANGTGIDVTSYSAVDVAVPSQSATLQSKTKSYTPSETAQSETVQADTGYDGLDTVSVSVGAISSTYVGSGIDRRDSTDLSASGATVSVPSGYYESSASKSVASGTAGNPSASKGTVTNHAVSVTPSVTNTTGYITGGTKTGTAVSVSAAELVSGSLSITSNNTYDVTNLAEVVVNVSSGGSSKNVQYVTGRYEVASSSYTATDLSIKVSKAGTYKCYWVMDRSTTSGTSGSQLYKNNTAVGSVHTTWSHTNNTRVQECEETLTFALNDQVVVRARSRSASYYAGVTNFFIVEQ